MMMDLRGLGFGQAKNISPFYAKRITSLLQVLCECIANDMISEKLSMLGTGILHPNGILHLTGIQVHLAGILLETGILCETGIFLKWRLCTKM